MAKTHQSEKFVEIRELYVIKAATGSVSARCVECAPNDASMVVPQRAAAVVHVPLWIIYRWVELGTVHYKEGPDGSITICLRSLLTPWEPTNQTKNKRSRERASSAMQDSAMTKQTKGLNHRADTNAKLSAR